MSLSAQMTELELSFTIDSLADPGPHGTDVDICYVRKTSTNILTIERSFYELNWPSYTEKI